MLKLKHILSDVAEYAYRDDPRLPQYKKFYVEYLDKRLKSKLGDYRHKDHHIRVFTKERSDLDIFWTSIHELAHHVDYVQRGASGHGREFYAVYTKLLYTSLDMGLFTLEEYMECSRTSSDHNKVLRILERYTPHPVSYKKDTVRFRVQRAYEIREHLKARGYTYNGYNRIWEKEIRKENVPEEENFLRWLGADFSTENARTLTF